MAETFNVAVVKVGGIEVVVVHVDAKSVSIPELQARTMKWFQARLLGKNVVLMHVDLMKTPIYMGAPNLVALLRGKGVNDLAWQKVLMS